MNQSQHTEYENLLDTVLKTTEGYQAELDKISVQLVQRSRDEFAALQTLIAVTMRQLLKDRNDAERAYTKAFRDAIKEITAQMSAQKPKVVNIRDMARYEAELKCLPLEEAWDSTIENYEAANVLVRYSLPKLLDAVASRIGLALKYPEGANQSAGLAGAPVKDTFDDVFGKANNALMHITPYTDDDELREGVDYPGEHEESDPVENDD